MMDLYKLLGIKETASQDEIKRAYRKAVHLYHPDKNIGRPEVAERFRQIREAYEVLNNPESKKQYDRQKSYGYRTKNEKQYYRGAAIKTVSVMTRKRTFRPGEDMEVSFIFDGVSTNIDLNIPQGFTQSKPLTIRKGVFTSQGKAILKTIFTYTFVTGETGYFEVGPAYINANGQVWSSDKIIIRTKEYQESRTRDLSDNINLGAKILGISLFIWIAIHFFADHHFKKPLPLIANTPARSLKYMFSSDYVPPTNSIKLMEHEVPSGYPVYEKTYGRGIFSDNTSNKILISNGDNTDVVVFLLEMETKETFRHHYIRAGDNYIIDRIPWGVYYMKVYFGNNWNPEKKNPETELTGGFSRNQFFKVFKDKESIFDLNQTDEEGNKKGVTYHVSLYPVKDGNYVGRLADSKAFFDE